MERNVENRKHRPIVSSILIKYSYIHSYRQLHIGVSLTDAVAGNRRNNGGRRQAGLCQNQKQKYRRKSH